MIFLYHLRPTSFSYLFITLCHVISRGSHGSTDSIKTKTLAVFVLAKIMRSTCQHGADITTPSWHLDSTWLTWQEPLGRHVYTHNNLCSTRELTFENDSHTVLQGSDVWLGDSLSSARRRKMLDPIRLPAPTIKISSNSMIIQTANHRSTKLVYESDDLL